MYFTIADIFVWIFLVFSTISAVLVIGSATWNWIDDREYVPMFPKIGDMLDVKSFKNIDNIFLELIILAVMFFMSMFAALGWPLSASIMLAIYIRNLRRKQKKEQGNDTSTTN